ncbi:hypothetical protein HYPSUDRAFT_151241 [Hypholoma sublateritium FD-334 SS-4]|uniref:AB hydrolase-1 domain-containing protein n=1 Tax=Hypholoma sublateritium (strain FD-334 SS-4) TaxID=945553 RepID=A0A0D2N3C7_HYPSF|nr:hypothetical protein HYPSUDRAFT_151241 [Hypholoma sublateritium FD-334 SS-4]
MPSITVSDNITFEYIDSGDIEDSQYTTLIVLHGHSFQNRIFEPLFPFAKPKGLRIICVNRRSYPGSTPYTADEMDIIHNGSDEAHALFLHEQGVFLALFVDGIIRRHSLQREGGIALVAWSMGNFFALCILDSLQYLPLDTKERLSAYVHTYIAWDPPSAALGVPNPEGAFLPLWGEGFTPGDPDNVFGTWVSGHFTHDNLASKDFSKLNQRNFHAPNIRPPTLSRMSAQEILSTTAVSIGAEFDTPVASPGAFEAPLQAQAARTLFDKDSEARAAWKELDICVMYCEASPWPGIYGSWIIEKMGKGAGIKFKSIAGANHFVRISVTFVLRTTDLVLVFATFQLMWEDPERCLDSFKECITDDASARKS